MVCSTCAKRGMIEIRMKVAGEDLLFHRCGRCESKFWGSDEGPLTLSRVIDKARVTR